MVRAVKRSKREEVEQSEPTSFPSLFVPFHDDDDDDDIICNPGKKRPVLPEYFERKCVARSKRRSKKRARRKILLGIWKGLLHIWGSCSAQVSLLAKCKLLSAKMDFQKETV